ncbi:META domain-containing protein [Desulfogranum mediterraneum]|uniref:META domain-containing protein n=1 Tax=Desulfogranum mediterraneum TaxID=160661 RepID=UPI001377DEE9|nr:META domain-containing protein [Desulfogranum mediterraneum]
MNKLTGWCIGLLFVLLATGCGSTRVQQAGEELPVEENPLILELPASFSGRIPCADCDYVRIDLNLRPDKLYQLRKTRVNGGKVVKSEAQMRRWRFDPQENLIILGKRKGALKTYLVEDPDTLRFLDIQGEQQEGLISYSLVRSPSYDPFNDEVKIRGMYRSSGNSHILRECASELDFSVDPSAAFSELDRAYRNTPHEPNQPLLVSIQGRLLLRGASQDWDEDVIVVSSFNRLYSNQDCSGNLARQSLFGVNWRAIEIGGTPITAANEGRSPFLTLEAKGNRVKGFSGCNRFFGTYLFKGKVFIFNKLASTRMACPDNIALENAFLAALNNTESYQMEDNLLVLRDKNDEVTMKLQAQDGS